MEIMTDKEYAAVLAEVQEIAESPKLSAEYLERHVVFQRDDHSLLLVDHLQPTVITKMDPSVPQVVVSAGPDQKWHVTMNPVACECWPDAVKQFTINHEIGHINCGHLADGEINATISHEIEADAFAMEHMNASVADMVYYLNTAYDPIIAAYGRGEADRTKRFMRAVITERDQRIAAIIERGLK